MTVLLWLVAGLLGTDQIPAGSAKVEVSAGGQALEVFTYKPPSYRDGPLILVFHGVLRNAQDYRDHACAMGDRFGALIAAPQFDLARFPVEAYQQGNILKEGQPVPPEQYTGRLIAPLVNELRRREGRPEMPYYLIGHSGGGQFLVRAAGFTATGAARIVAANPGTHLIPDRTQPFPYGFGGLPEESSADEALRRYLAQPLTIYLGANDTQVDEHLDQRPPAQHQGATRLERGRNAFACARDLARQNGWPFHWRLIEVAGVGHDHERMFNHAQCAQALFGGSADLAVWPQFRGPDGQGHAAQAGLPVHWSEKKHVVWKTLLPGQGWSSPVIQADQIWLTTAIDSGKSLRAICVDRNSGAIRHNVEVFRKDDPGRIHQKNGHASPTPVIAGDRVYVHFGAHGTACLSTAGEILWKTELPYYHHHGPAASPVLVGDKLIVACDGFTDPWYDQVRRDVAAPQFLAALGANGGEVLWKKPREGRHSYATPLAIEVAGRTQLVSPGGNRVIAYDPATGDEIWWCRFQGYSLVPRPVFGHGRVYVCTGYDSPATLLAIRPDGTGDVTDSHVEWKQTTQAVPNTPSPILVGSELYFVSDAGVASCVDAKTGKLHWRQRLGGNFSASPIAAENHVYFLGEAGLMHVLEAGTKYRRISTNGLEGPALASPAVSDRSLYLRSGTFLYRIEEKNHESHE